MPIQSAPSGLVDVADPEALPGVQAVVAERLEPSTLSLSPSQPPTVCSATIVSGSRLGDDHEELQHLVVDRRGQAAERDVDEHDRGGDDDRRARSTSRAAGA